MGYEVHIVRKKDYEDYEEESNITYEEFASLVDRRPELEWEAIEGYINSDKKDYCYWNSYPAIVNNNSPWLHYFRGEISTKWTEDDCLSFWLELANELGGQLRGDEGEQYDEAELERLRKQHQERSTPNVIIKKKPFWKIW
jgi:hypothetical protein